MTPRFEECLKFILRWEGGAVDHPADPGGRTNKGITQKVFADWLRGAYKPVRDVFTITDAEVSQIYWWNYWLPAKCDKLPQPLDLVQFDTAVQRGPHKAAKMLQSAVGVLPDGIIGPQTMVAVESLSPKTTAHNYIVLRKAHYEKRVREDASQCVFLKGWMNRITDLEKEIA